MLDSSSVVSNCILIYEKNGIKTPNNSKELKTILTLDFKIKIVKYAYDILINNIKLIEKSPEIRIKNGYITYLIPLIYLFESYIIQVRILMDFWAKYFIFLPGYQNLGESFNKHKKNIKNINDKEYQNFVLSMDWFDNMKKIRDGIKSGTTIFPFFNEKEGKFLMLSMNNKINTNIEKNMKKFCEDNYNKIFDYINFIFIHFLKKSNTE